MASTGCKIISSTGAVDTLARKLSDSSDILNPARLFVNSELSERYAKYRPKLPTQHVETVVKNLLKRRPGLWVDVGCGPGTSTQQIIGYSDKIIGIDISDTQIAVAKKNITDPSVTFLQGSCDALPVSDNSVDVISAVQAAHYFDLPAFFKEVERCLVPGGYLCLIGYPCPTISNNPPLSDAYHHIYFSYLRPYILDVPIYQYLNKRYATMELPFNDTRQVYSVDIAVPSRYEEILDHLMSYSAVARIEEVEQISGDEVRRRLDEELGVCEKEAVFDFVHECFMVVVQKPCV